MESHRLELKSLVKRQTSRCGRDTRRSLGESSRCLLENLRQSHAKQVSSRTTASDQISEFYSALYSSNYDDVGEKTAKFFETRKSYEESAIYGPLKEFSKDVTSLLYNTVFSDVEIKCGGEVIKAHRNILASRSPVFNAMFSNSMIESATGVVTIDDLDSQVVHDLLTFIYSNKVQNLSLVKACGLLEASTKYQVQTLKDICVDYLISMMTREHALLILQKADLYDEKLKRCTMNFISEKFFDLRVTEEWITMQKHNPILALEVCNVVIDQLAGKN